MSETDTDSRAFVVGPEEAESYWQPVPANGFIRNILSQAKCNSVAPFALGTQTVAPQSFIREHTHDRHEECIHVVEGKGIARVEGVEHVIEKGSTVWVGLNKKHHFLNPHDEPMTFVWLLLPGGLDDFFREIGRERTPGQPAPEPFPRPANVEEIERRTVFGWADGTYTPKGE
ncbi:MAG: cupin domain-containing protein [Pseudomonadota bacterium]|nr:cupin domain-containing protein [Pseudomonadota bacterium]